MAYQSNPAPPRNRSNRTRVVVIVSVIVLVIGAAIVGAELYARHTVVNCMTEQFEADLGSKVDIGLSAKPVLLQAIDKKVPYVTIDSADDQFGPAIGMEVHARADNIDISGSDTSAATIGSSTADITWSTDGILKTVQDQPFGGLISSVEANETDGTLTFSVGPGGLAQLVVRPTLGNGDVDVETVSAEVLGFGLPTDLVDGVVQIVSKALQVYPLGMTPNAVHVDNAGVTMSLSGGRYELPPVSNDAQNCSLV